MSGGAGGRVFMDMALSLECFISIGFLRVQNLLGFKQNF